LNIEADRSAIGLLRVLLAASVLGPVVLFGVVAWLDYRAAFDAAEHELFSRSQIAAEQAVRIFDGESQVADRVNELVRGLDARAIRQSEQTLHEAFGRIVARLPQMQSVLLVGKDGHPLVSAGIYPVPGKFDLRGHDYMRAILGGSSGTYVSALQFGDVNQQNFFGLAKPWIGADGTVSGVIDVAVLPSSFEDFYHALVGEGGGAAGRFITLVRADGQILVRYPPVVGAPPAAPPGSAFLAAIRARPEFGIYGGRSIIDRDSPVRVYAYRHVAGYPVYVVAAASRSAIIAGWQRTVGNHLLFAVPATALVFALTWTALARTRREAQALALARQEISRRESAEAALLRSQRLEAVGQMTGGVAHDFNNLLTVILGSAEVLQKRADDPARVRRLAEQIMLATRRGSEITQQLLAFARRHPVHPVTADLNSCLKEFAEMLGRVASESIRLAFDLADDLDPVWVDVGHFEAAILNLVGNAHDAMPDGGVVLIRTRNLALMAAAEVPAGAYVCVAVTDQGMGMDAQTAAKAFEPFFTTKGVGKGTGLGLSQVYGFAKQAGGDVRLTTAPGQGTTVELVLPRTDRIADLACPTGSEAVALRAANTGEVVLLVEDEPEVRELAAESLADLGYAVLTAATAPDALERLRSGVRVDLLFSDVVMQGGMNGVQLALEARRMRPELKVLLTSGYTGSIDRGQVEDIPLLSKPYDREALASRLRAVLLG
jgi:two-component system NtrC family sensor kinase